ncbi:23S rRNA (adenine(2030)-N(6))-methyltransferase RlmJ [Devosia ginsengisoli]|uniref:23S rRNA (adenine(2030)-N(6))-methyltransferase RlmJ n=1 Tax=Devosia ginsengisoli TaxID=400770 RepID=UPI0026F26FE4|nr:23S rRNA (adenine(2030)-N(6))-methyltransferase RlmJ [Devosia ginsengisoli]MCR6671154.1 23S rRNA (adenine(2030)-N(6))-methyltransferase RlmJ [Devosia ginsengisoli]
MNYRHAFHAGNFADVVKHLILTRIVEYLKRKPAAFRVLDTHAGVGLYDLEGDEAGRTSEWVDGIGRLIGAALSGPATELAAPYLDAIRAQNPGGGLRFYPGSPLIVRHLLREQDRLFALELHPDDAAALRENFAGDIQTRATHLDGWAALGTHLPPKEKRGLVLVDPPFEEKGEFARMVAGLVKAHQRWPGGIYAFWYPIKEPAEVEQFIRDLKATGMTKILRIELTTRAPSTPPRLHGTGMIVVNPPFVLEEEMQVLLPELANLLASEGQGKWRMDWVAEE